MAFRLMTQLFNTTAWRRDPVLSILIEEAWKTIASANMADYIKYLYKTVRKYFGEAIVVTQEVDDIISSCAACANVSANAAGLAQPAQTSRQMPRDLRDLRKRFGKCRGTCAACANASANAAGLARLAQTLRQMPRDPARPAQTPKQKPGDLRENPQTSKRMPGDLREYPQTPKSSSRHLQQCCRHFQKRFGLRVASVEVLCLHRTHVT